MKGQIPILMVLVLGVILFAGIAAIIITQDYTTESSHLKKFLSYQEMENYIQSSIEAGGMPYMGMGMEVMRSGVPVMAPTVGGDVAESEVTDYSTTNIQVEGVDEADIVKNDGRYVYVVSGEKVYIVDAYPAEGASIISEIDPNGSVSEIFINGDKLVLFGQKSREYEVGTRCVGIPGARCIMPEPYYYSPEMFTKVYDMSDRENPSLVRDITMNGTYYDSRMIGDYVYIVVNSPIQRDHIIVPLIYEDSVPVRSPGVFPDVYYFDNPESSYRFTTIMSVNTQDDNEPVNSEIYMMGYAHNMYVSLDNIYITYEKRFSPYVFYDRIIDEVILPITPPDIDSQITIIRNKPISESEKMNEVSEVIGNYFNSLSQDEKQNVMTQLQQRVETFYSNIAKELEKTIIHKISINNGDIEYKAQGDVPGYVLNQFSMDQNKGYFRIATTTRDWGFGTQTQSNNLYVLDQDLNRVGTLEDLTKGERIYSARFIGDRAYMVTFKKIDPLFVIDLSNPASPQVLGKLKIPGFSDYLHPYDENHIIGIGKETVESEQGDFAWYQGMKLALFDVSDVNNPIQLHHVVIGDRGTDSYALHDHKAFLFDREKNLLVLPILLAEMEDRENQPDWSRGEYIYQGAYVYGLTPENGFEFRGRVTHYDTGTPENGFGFWGDYSIQRSLYIENVLYTISQGMIKMNSLTDLAEINKLFFV